MSDPWRDNVLSTGAELSYVEREHTALVKRDASGDGPGLEWIGATLARDAQAPRECRARLVGDVTERTIASAPSVTRSTAQRLSGTWISALGPVSAADQRLDAGGTPAAHAGLNRVRRHADTSYDQLPEAEFAYHQARHRLYD